MSLLEQFHASPCQEVFMQLTKQDLLQLAKHYNLSDVKISLKSSAFLTSLLNILSNKRFSMTLPPLLFKKKMTIMMLK